MEFDPDVYTTLKPKITGGVVSAKFEPETKWVVEVIGMGGRVDLDLGTFPTYRSALYRALQWSDANPEDRRLTREREVKAGEK